MPIFSYQSFNAAASKTHDLNSVTAQPLTVDTHNHWANANQGASSLIYPTLENADFDPKYYPKGPPVDRHAIPVQGPPDLVQAEPPGSMSQDAVSTSDFFEMMKQKVLQNRQAVYREMQDMPHVTAFGELDGAHSDFQAFPEFAGGVMAGASTNKLACQNFSVYAANGAQVKCVGNGIGWYAIKYLGYVVVFVHVPNAIAKSSKPTPAKPPKPPKAAVKGVGAQSQAKPAPAKPYGRPAAAAAPTNASKDDLVKFYQDIASVILQNGGGVIDVVMGDTNQSSGGVTPEALSKATNLPFANAHVDNTLSPIDAYNIQVYGTNSSGTKMFDVAVYNTGTVKLKKLCYWSQQAPIGDGSTVAAVTDHMGLAIHVEKK